MAIQGYEDFDVQLLLQWMALEREALFKQLTIEGQPLGALRPGEIQGTVFIRGELKEVLLCDAGRDVLGRRGHQDGSVQGGPVVDELCGNGEASVVEFAFRDPLHRCR